MPVTRHVERHFTSGDTVRDIVIGMSDGLTVPFALAAGLSGAVESTSIVITAGLAEIAAGSIAMGLGGYLAARSDAEHYASERRREQAEVRDIPAADFEPQPSGHDAIHVEQVFDDLRLRPRVARDDVEPLAGPRGIGCAALKDVRPAENRIQRRAQLV